MLNLHLQGGNFNEEFFIWIQTFNILIKHVHYVSRKLKCPSVITGTGNGNEGSRKSGYENSEVIIYKKAPLPKSKKVIALGNLLKNNISTS